MRETLRGSASGASCLTKAKDRCFEGVTTPATIVTVHGMPIIRERVALLGKDTNDGCWMDMSRVREERESQLRVENRVLASRVKGDIRHTPRAKVATLSLVSDG